MPVKLNINKRIVRNVRRLAVRLIILLIGIFIVVSLVRSIITIKNEEKGVDIVKAVMIEKFTPKNVVRLDDSNFLSRADGKHMKKYLAKQGWKFEEKYSSGENSMVYIFKNDKNEQLMMFTNKTYSSAYAIWNYNKDLVEIK